MIPDGDVDEDKAGLKVENREEEQEEEDDDDLEVSDKDIDRNNDNEEEDRPNNTKLEMSKNLSFVKVVLDSVNLLPLNVDRETLQESVVKRTKPGITELGR